MRRIAISLFDCTHAEGVFAGQVLTAAFPGMQIASSDYDPLADAVHVESLAAIARRVTGGRGGRAHSNANRPGWQRHELGCIDCGATGVKQTKV